MIFIPWCVITNECFCFKVAGLGSRCDSGMELGNECGDDAENPALMPGQGSPEADRLTRLVCPVTLTLAQRSYNRAFAHFNPFCGSCCLSFPPTIMAAPSQSLHPARLAHTFIASPSAPSTPVHNIQTMRRKAAGHSGPLTKILVANRGVSRRSTLRSTISMRYCSLGNRYQSVPDSP